MYNIYQGTIMQSSEIMLELMYDKIKSLEKFVEEQQKGTPAEHSTSKLARIAMLEKQVLELQTEVGELKSRLSVLEAGPTDRHTAARQTLVNSPPPAAGKRDTTKYMWEGNVYLKNRLVLAIVRDYAKRHPGITRRQLKTIFDKTLQGSIGVVEDEDTAKLRNDCDKRFFAKPDEALTLADGNMYVCTQWGILNIPRFLARARELGYDIKEIR